MSRYFISIFYILLIAGQIGHGQEPIHHWEMLVDAGDTWRYFSEGEPDPNWKNSNFNDTSWPQGTGGIGYDDGDDTTIIPPTISLYMRCHFSVENLSVIGDLIFCMDYDDAFVAYINGVEIARANIGTLGNQPGYMDLADSPREAQMYQGGQPEYFPVTAQSLESLLVPGDNVLAIQVHNQSAISSDMSAIPFLCVGLTTSSNQYRPTPEWFSPPLQFTSSNLPIVQIDTDGRTIPNDYRLPMQMHIRQNPDGRTSLSSDIDFSGRVNIEIRGSSSSNFEKKSYGFETQDSTGANLNVKLLGMPRENDWILYGPYSDKSLLRNAITFHIARAFGQYASRTQFCELLINGEYQGLYLLMEKIKRDDDRVDIDTLEPDEITGDDLTGGYIIKVDKEEGNYRGWRSLASGSSIFFQYVYPKPDEIVPEQEDYIQHYLADFERALLGKDYQDPNLGYARFIDMLSFVDAFIINELTKDIDGYRFSTFMYKDKNGPLTMGPIWDYNLGYGNVDYGGEGAMNTDGWIYNTGGARMWWWTRMMRDPAFKNALGERWQELRNGPLHWDTINAVLDSMIDLTTEARVRNFQRWPILGVYVWPNYFVGETYEEEIDFLKNWIYNRLVWMDDNMPEPVDVTVNQDERLTSKITVYPNPFNQSTTLIVALDKAAKISIAVYDIKGRMIKSIDNGYRQAGEHRYTWNSGDLPSGLYLARISTSNRSKVVKLLLVK